MKFNELETLDTESRYVIRLTVQGERRVQDPRTKKFRTESYQTYVFFKDDRYSMYGPRIQTESDPSLAAGWQTAKGAQNALDRLTKKGSIKDRHEAMVFKHTRTVTRMLEEVPAGVSV